MMIFALAIIVVISTKAYNRIYEPGGVLYSPKPVLKEQKNMEATTTKAATDTMQYGTIREVTAYNAGDVNQTDGDPCIGASGKDICKMLEDGKIVLAANFVPFGAKLKIENFGIGEVWDRTNSRYKNRVDIAMKLDEKQRAINFGKQKLLVAELK